MAQVVRPVSDVSTGSWTPTPVYQQIDETDPDNSTTEVTSGNDPTTEIFEVKFPKLEPPVAGTHVLKVRLKRTGSSEDVWALVQLMQGNRQVAAKGVKNPATSYETTELTLTDDEVNRITDYEDLRLSVTAMTPGACIYCTTGTVQPAYKITFSGVENDDCLVCDSVNGTYITTQGGNPCDTVATFLSQCAPHSFMQINTDISLGDLIVTIHLDRSIWPNRPYARFKLELTDPFDCTGPFNVPFYFQSDHLKCDFSNATCIVAPLT